MRLYKLAVSLILVAIIAQVVQAEEEPAELNNESVKIQDIVQNEKAFDGKMVVIEGRIDDECGSGCWLIVNDDTASLYVTIRENNIVIPQKRGSQVKVYGEVTTINGDPAMIGKIVEINGEIYR